MSTQSAFFSSTYPRGLITRLCGLAWMVWMLWEGAHKMLQGAEGNQVPEAFQTFCMDCHDSDTAKGNLDLEQALKHPLWMPHWRLSNSSPEGCLPPKSLNPVRWSATRC